MTKQLIVIIEIPDHLDMPDPADLENCVLERLEPGSSRDARQRSYGDARRHTMNGQVGWVTNVVAHHHRLDVQITTSNFDPEVTDAHQL